MNGNGSTGKKKIRIKERVIKVIKKICETRVNSVSHHKRAN